MIAHPHTLPNGPCPGARTFGLTVRNCVRCGALLDNGDTRMTPTEAIARALEGASQHTAVDPVFAEGWHAAIAAIAVRLADASVLPRP